MYNKNLLFVIECMFNLLLINWKVSFVQASNFIFVQKDFLFPSVHLASSLAHESWREFLIKFSAISRPVSGIHRSSCGMFLYSPRPVGNYTQFISLILAICALHSMHLCAAKLLTRGEYFLWFWGTLQTLSIDAEKWRKIAEAAAINKWKVSAHLTSVEWMHVCTL